MRFNIFRRKINKNTQIQPGFIADFFPISFKLTSQDGTSFACIDRIASELANLNYSIFSTKDRQKLKKHPLYAVLKEPNVEDRHFNFFYQSVIDYFNGGVFWYKGTVDNKVVSLFRLDPQSVRVKRDDNNRRIFEYRTKQLASKEIIYIPSRFGYSTSSGGQSIFKAVDAVFQTSGNLERYTQASFANGVMGKRTVIDVSGAFPNITTEQATEIKENFQAEYSGAENAGRPILEKKGIEYSELGGNADNKSAELAENRKFQEHEIAKVFGVPEELLTVSGAKNGANLENVFTLFSEFAIRPVATQFQEAINSLLDEESEYFEFDYNGILKVSFQQRIDAYTKQINNGLLSPNEARAKENLEPIEAGDNHFMPVNLMPLNDETINAYMAKQKNEIANGGANPTDENSQHFGGGDDKQ